MDENQYQLIAEQLGHMKDLIEARFKRIEGLIEHQCTLEKERLDVIRMDMVDIKVIAQDHETRLRLNTDNITVLKTNLTTAQALQATFTLVLAAIAAWLGSK